MEHIYSEEVTKKLEKLYARFNNGRIAELKNLIEKEYSPILLNEYHLICNEVINEITNLLNKSSYKLLIKTNVEIDVSHNCKAIQFDGNNRNEILEFYNKYSKFRIASYKDYIKCFMKESEWLVFSEDSMMKFIKHSDFVKQYTIN